MTDLNYERPLTELEKEDYRTRAKITFAELEQQIFANKTSSESVKSWIRSSGEEQEQEQEQEQDDWLLHRSNNCLYFDTYGFLVLPGFANESVVMELKQQMLDLVNNDWDPTNESEFDTFGTDTTNNMKRGDYFLDSSNKVHYFAEPTALVENNSNLLKPEYSDNKIGALNKAGHAMHIIPGPFRDYTLSDKMKNLVLELGWKDPVVPQSMYIFKQPKIGGSVTSHQDSTFLFTSPKQTCLGLWLALDDANLDNGCLWVRPKSHLEPLRRQFIRNPDYFTDNNNNNNNNNNTDDDGEGKEKEEASPKQQQQPPKLIFKTHHENPNVTWEGKLPSSLSDVGFIPVEVKSGDLVVFCGTLDHLSLPNYSSKQRHTFQLHLVEGPKYSNIKWSKSNWLQYPTNQSFVKLVE